MAQNLASEYSPKIDKRFSLKSVTDDIVSNEYDWTGVVTVNVYSMDTVAMGDYTRSGLARYGTPGEVGTQLQAMTLTKDRSYTATIDQGNHTEEKLVTKANEFIRMQTDEIVVPEIDTRRIAVMTAAATANSATDTTAATVDNAYKLLVDAGVVLDEAKVPQDGRIALVTPSFHAFLIRDDEYIKDTDAGQAMAIKGVVGEAAGFMIKKVPSSYFPANTEFVTVRKGTVVGPRKLNDLKIHDNPPGVNGKLIEARFIYDAFVLDNKIDTIFWQKKA